VDFHVEVPLITFLGLAHFRIALVAFVLGGTRCRNDGGVHNAVFAQHQAILLQMLVHFLEQQLAKNVMFQKMKKLEDGGFIRQAIQLQAGKAPHACNLVQDIIHERINRVVEGRHAKAPEYCGQQIRWSARLALKIIAGDLLLQLRPKNQLIHPF